MPQPDRAGSNSVPAQRLTGQRLTLLCENVLDSRKGRTMNRVERMSRSFGLLALTLLLAAQSGYAGPTDRASDVREEWE